MASMPKIIAETLMEEDWYVDPTNGINIIEFERPSTSGPYKMLHLVMDVLRQNPSHDRRGPRLNRPQYLKEAHNTVVRRLFRDDETVITEENINMDDLQRDLDLIFARRKKYMDGNYEN